MAGINLSAADLSDTEFSAANLNNADGQHATLAGAGRTQVMPVDTDWTAADLREATRKEADLYNALVEVSRVHHADLRGGSNRDLRG